MLKFISKIQYKNNRFLNNLSLILIALLCFNYLFSLDKIEKGLEYTPSYHLQTDEFSDSDVYYGAINYNKEGYLKNNLFPNLKGSNGKTEDFIYMGYPSFPFIFEGLLLKSGLTLYQTKLISAFIMLVSVFLITFCILNKIQKRENSALVYTAILLGMLATPWYYDNLGSVHQRPLGLLIIGLIIWASTIKQSIYSLVSVSLLAFLISNISYEYYFLIFLYVFGLLILINKNNEVILKNIVAISAGLVGGFAFHVARAINTTSNYSLIDALQSRLSGVDGLAHLTPNYFDILKSFQSITAYNFGLDFYVLLIAFIYAIKDLSIKNKIGALLILFSGVSWAIIMKQHFYVHFHVMPFHIGWIIFSIATVAVITSNKYSTIFGLLFAGIFLQIYYVWNTDSKNINLGLINNSTVIYSENEDWHKLSNRYHLIDGIKMNGNYWTVGNDCITNTKNFKLTIQYRNLQNVSLLELYYPGLGSDIFSFVPDIVNLKLINDNKIVLSSKIEPTHVENYNVNNRDNSLLLFKYNLGKKIRFDKAEFVFENIFNPDLCKKPPRISELTWR